MRENAGRIPVNPSKDDIPRPTIWKVLIHHGYRRKMEEWIIVPSQMMRFF